MKLQHLLLYISMILLIIARYHVKKYQTLVTPGDIAYIKVG